jgi:hypothetical protein
VTTLCVGCELERALSDDHRSSVIERVIDRMQDRVGREVLGLIGEYRDHLVMEPSAARMSRTVLNLGGGPG